MSATQAEYLSAAETAKLVRVALKRHFPGVKFSVRSETYSMGAAVRVHWTGGPSRNVLREVVDQYSGSRFDAMVDARTYHDSWLLPDGSAFVASVPSPHPDSRLVQFGADTISLHPQDA